MPVNQSLFSRCLAFLIFNLAVGYSHAAAKEIVLLVRKILFGMKLSIFDSTFHRRLQNNGRLN